MGLAAPQSPFEAHATHCPLDEQRGRSDWQSVGLRHCTQAPLDVSQRGASWWQDVLLVHFAWHWPSMGEQTGLAAPQSEDERQATHEPRTQKGVPEPQSPSLWQSVQPMPDWQPFMHTLPPTEHDPSAPWLDPHAMAHSATARVEAKKVPKVGLGIIVSSSRARAATASLCRVKHGLLHRHTRGAREAGALRACALDSL